MGPEPAGLAQFQSLFQRIINLSAGAAFIILAIMLVIASFQYLTSAGDSKALPKANQTLTWALLGILFLAIAWLLLKLVTVFTGVDVEKFCIGFPPYCLR